MVRRCCSCQHRLEQEVCHGKTHGRGTGCGWNEAFAQGVASWPKLRLAVSAVLFGITALSLTGFTNGSDSDKPETDRDTSRAAIKWFWTAYHGNDYQAIPHVQIELRRAIENDPDNPTLYALLGATYFWHVGEAARDTVPDDPTLAQDMPNAVDFFGKALQLDYYTKHLIGYVNDDHLPGYLGITTFHLGQQYKDSALMEKGERSTRFRRISISGI